MKRKRKTWHGQFTRRAHVHDVAMQLPVEGWASDFASAKYDRADPT